MKVHEAVRKEYVSSHRRSWLTSLGLVTVGQVLAGLSIPTGLPPHIALGISLAAIGAGGANHFAQRRHLITKTEELCSKEGLTSLFQKTHIRELADGDQFIVSLWERVRPPLMQTLAIETLSSLPKVHSTEMNQVEEILNKEVPYLRRMAAPAPS